MNSRTNLLGHQREAVTKMLPSRLGALFMEMGTGKSRTAIELVIQRLHKIDKVIWFAPVSLKETVRQEIFKHTDCLPSDVHVFNHRTSEKNIPKCLWYVVGIESMSSSARVVLTVNKLISSNTFIILDESSYIKGHQSMRTERITKFCERARYRLILTGTPISQGIVDLFAQMRFLSPKILGYKSFYSFQANHLEYHPKFKGMITRAHNTDFIAAKIKPYVYQVTKEECLDLPNKIYESRYVGMSIDQRVLYEQAKNEILLEINDDEFDSFTIFRLFTALQQIACGFWNRRNADKVMEFLTFKQHRIAALMETISNIPSNEKIIIWAKYLYDIEQINTALTTEYGNDAVSQFHGRLSEQEKISQIDKFRGPARFFLATPSSGGHGLTLNEACYVIFYNNGFKYSERIQAEDRCHRIGQTRKVVYIDLVCVPSIDERISQALAKKENVVAKFKAEIDKVKKEGRRALIKNL